MMKSMNDLDVGATGFMTPWPTKKNLANMGARIRMQEGRMQGNDLDTPTITLSRSRHQ